MHVGGKLYSFQNLSSFLVLSVKFFLLLGEISIDQGCIATMFTVCMPLGPYV